MKPTHVNYSSLKTLHFAEGIKAKALLKSKDTNGLQAIFEDIVEPGYGPPRHIHHQQDETFLFLEGEFDVEIGDQLFRINAGDVAFVPKGQPHTWKNVGNIIGRLRYIFSPALNIEEMFEDMHILNERSEFNEEAMFEMSKKYPEQETVGPPL